MSKNIAEEKKQQSSKGNENSGEKYSQNPKESPDKKAKNLRHPRSGKQL